MILGHEINLLDLQWWDIIHTPAMLRSLVNTVHHLTDSFQKADVTKLA